MRLKSSVAAFVGLLTLVPWAWLFIYLVVLIPKLSSLEAAGLARTPEYARLHGQVFFLGSAAVMFTLTLLAAFVFYVLRSDHIPPPAKPRWRLLLYLGSIFVMPVIWYKFMRPRATPSHASRLQSP